MAGKIPKYGESVLDKFPEVAAEWNYDLNINEYGMPMVPQEYKGGSREKVWWTCNKCENIWQACIANRCLLHQGCPKCAPQKIIEYRKKPKEGGSLAEKFPEIAAEWDYDANDGLTPSDVKYGSNQEGHWICPKGHKWSCMIYHRTMMGYKCPECNHRGTSFPEQFIFWSFKEIFEETDNRNRELKKVEYDIVIPELNLNIEFSGDYWHRNKEERDIYKNKLCQEEGIDFIYIFDKRRVLYIYKNEKLIKEINYTDSKKPEALQECVKHIFDLYNISLEKIDWEDIRQKAYKYSSSDIRDEESLVGKRPELLDEWNYEKNKDIDPYNVKAWSKMRVYWKCKKGHEWEIGVRDRAIYGHNCPECAKTIRAYKQSKYCGLQVIDMI